MMEAARTSETSVDKYFTRQYIPEDNSELHTRRRENLKSHIFFKSFIVIVDSIFKVHSPKTLHQHTILRRNVSTLHAVLNFIAKWLTDRGLPMLYKFSVII
jgi:hypothetical protein